MKYRADKAVCGRILLEPYQVGSPYKGSAWKTFRISRKTYKALAAIERHPDRHCRFLTHYDKWYYACWHETDFYTLNHAVLSDLTLAGIKGAK